MLDERAETAQDNQRDIKRSLLLAALHKHMQALWFTSLVSKKEGEKPQKYLNKPESHNNYYRKLVV